MWMYAEAIASWFGEWTWNPIYEEWMWFLDIGIWYQVEDMIQYLPRIGL